MSSRSNRMLYVGNLPADFRERDVEDIFYKYGPIVKIDLKCPPRPPWYCFIEFENTRDAEDAIQGRDGYDVDGHRLRVELAHGGRGSAPVDRHNNFNMRHNNFNSGGRRDGFLPRRSNYRVIITGLPSSASWQDLKDHMRGAGDVSFAQVFRDGNGTTGVVHYTNDDDMKYAIKKLDDSEFKNPFSRSYIRVKEYVSNTSISRSRSRSYSRSRSQSYSRSRSRSQSYSQSHCHSQSLSRSPSVSRRKNYRKSVRSRSRSGSLWSSQSKSLPRSKTRSRSSSRTSQRKARSGSLLHSRSPSPSHAHSPEE